MYFMRIYNFNRNSSLKLELIKICPKIYLRLQVMWAIKEGTKTEDA